MTNPSSNWVVVGKLNEKPIVGNAYEIHHVRKGTFTGIIRELTTVSAVVEVTKGKIHWASIENKLFNEEPEFVDVHADLVYLIEVNEQ